MSNVDTRKTGGGQTVSFVSVRLESEHLLPEQLVALLAEATDGHADIEVHVERQGTGMVAH